MSNAPRRGPSSSSQDRAEAAQDPDALRLPPILSGHVQSTTQLPSIGSLSYHNDNRDNTFARPASNFEAGQPRAYHAAGQHRHSHNTGPHYNDTSFRSEQDNQQPRPHSFSSPTSANLTDTARASPASPSYRVSTSYRTSAISPDERRDSFPEESSYATSQRLTSRARQISDGSSVSREYNSLSLSGLAMTGRSSLSYSESSAEAAPTSAPTAPLTQPSASITWRLNIRQQPSAARACGYGERDRRVIDPPPILELEAPHGALPEFPPQIRNNLCVAHASLYDEAGIIDCTMSDRPGRRAGGNLMGTLVASASKARNQHGQPGIFFAFPDLSCRNYGRYRLRFTLMVVDTAISVPGSASPIVSSAMSQVFEVYSAKDFPGMSASTPLTHALRRQGFNIPAKKGKQGKASKESDDEDSGDEH